MRYKAFPCLWTDWGFRIAIPTGHIVIPSGHKVIPLGDHQAMYPRFT